MIANLPPKQQRLIQRWLLNENLTYAEVVTRLQRDHGISVAISTLGEWYQRWTRPAERNHPVSQGPSLLNVLAKLLGGYEVRIRFVPIGRGSRP